MSTLIHGIDTGSSFALVTMTETGELVRVNQLDKPDTHKARAGKPATKKRPAIEPVPALELWQTWALHVQAIRRLLTEDVNPGDVVAVETVKRHKGTDAAHAYGRVLGAIEDAVYSRGATLVMVGVGSAKITATGYGRADKDAMISASIAKWGDRGWTEHTADAAFVCETARMGRE